MKTKLKNEEALERQRERELKRKQEQETKQARSFKYNRTHGDS